MPEVNFNLLNPSAELYSGPQVQMDPVAAYEKAKTQRQSNMLAQLYAKHYDPQTGGVNYNALIGEAAQSGLDVPKLMGEAQNQAQAQAELSRTQAQQKQYEATAREYEAKTKSEYDENRHKEVNRAISDISKYANKADAIAGIERNFEEGKLDQNAYDAVMGMVRAEPVWARSQSKILQSLLSEKEQLEMAAPKTSIGKLQSDYAAAIQRGDKVAAASIKKAIDIEAGGMSEYERAQNKIAQDRLDFEKQHKDDTTLSADERKRAAGREDLSNVLLDMHALYNSLSEQGGIVDVNAPWYKNLANRIATSSGGQLVGSALGTNEQSTRQSIKNMQPLLLMSISDASGLSTQRLNSDKELQFYLNAATDPSKDLQSNIDALQHISDKYKLGMKFSTKKDTPAAQTKVSGKGTKDDPIKLD